MTDSGKMLTLTLFALLLTAGSAAGGDKNRNAGSEVQAAMHQMQITINHAVDMAAEGSNLMLLGALGTAPGMDQVSIEQGGKMLADAEAMVSRVMSGEEMKDLHARMHGSRQVATMVDTHDLSRAALVYIDQLKKMAAAARPQEKPEP
jgi:hypothetical protein